MKATNYEAPLHHISVTQSQYTSWYRVLSNTNIRISHTLYTSWFTLIPPSCLRSSLPSGFSFVFSDTILNLFRISSISAACPAHPSFQALPQYLLAGKTYQASYYTQCLCTSEEYPLSLLYIFTWTGCSKSRLDYTRSIIFLYGVQQSSPHTF